MVRIALVLILSATSPLAATSLLAEGARLSLTCSVVTACDTGGQCASGEGPADFIISPNKIDEAGTGTYAVTENDGTPVLSQGLSQLGPFVWKPTEDTRMTLTVTGEDTAVLIRQGTGPDPWAETGLMTCGVSF